MFQNFRFSNTNFHFQWKLNWNFIMQYIFQHRVYVYTKCIWVRGYMCKLKNKMYARTVAVVRRSQASCSRGRSLPMARERDEARSYQFIIGLMISPSLSCAHLRPLAVSLSVVHNTAPHNHNSTSTVHSTIHIHRCSERRHNVAE